MEKLCINCKHCIVENHWFTDTEYFCNIHVKNEIDPVTGENIKINDLVYCKVERGLIMSCGPKGAYWVQK